MRTLLPRLLFAVITFTGAVAAVGCDEEPAGPPLTTLPGKPGTPAPSVPTIGNDATVIDACKASCAASATAERCSSTAAQLKAQADACAAACAEQVANVPKSCADDATAAYQCGEDAEWSCFNGASPGLRTDQCDDLYQAYRDCIVVGL